LDPFSMVVAIVAISCGTGIIVKGLETMGTIFGGGRHKSAAQAAEQRADLAEDRARMFELQVVESRRQNEGLQKQLDWHAKMLETQDRMLKQLGNGATSERLSPPEQPAGAGRT
ncbi:MAG: hypothetical protein ACRDI2_02965, partial [Chloroflexota bacterium]